MKIKLKIVGRAYKVPVKVLAAVEPDNKYAYIQEPRLYEND